MRKRLALLLCAAGVVGCGQVERRTTSAVQANYKTPETFIEEDKNEESIVSLSGIVAQHCRVSLEPIEEFRVRFTIRCEETTRVLLRQTPLEGVKGNIFVIQTRDGEKAKYAGRMVKRGAPTDSEYGVVKKEHPLSVVIDLRDFYELLSDQQYLVNFQGNAYSNQLPDSNVIEVPNLK